MRLFNMKKPNFLEPKYEPKKEEDKKIIKEEIPREEVLCSTNNMFDYSSSIPTIRDVKHLVKYMFNIYEQYLWMVTEDEKKYKQEHKYYIYDNHYSLIFDVRIREKDYTIITCRNYTEFEQCINDGKMDNIDSMEIRLILDYKNNYSKDYVMYNNNFTVSLKPFNICFYRKSNYDKLEMNAIESGINEILKRFLSINSIFCTK